MIFMGNETTKYNKTEILLFRNNDGGRKTWKREIKHLGGTSPKSIGHQLYLRIRLYKTNCKDLTREEIRLRISIRRKMAKITEIRLMI